MISGTCLFHMTLSAYWIATECGYRCKNISSRTLGLADFDTNVTSKVEYERVKLVLSCLD